MCKGRVEHLCWSQQLNWFLFLSVLTGKSLSDDQTAAVTKSSAPHSLAKSPSRDCSTQCDEQTDAPEHTPAPSSGVYLTILSTIKIIWLVIWLVAPTVYKKYVCQLTAMCIFYLCRCYYKKASDPNSCQCCQDCRERSGGDSHLKIWNFNSV